MSTLTKSLVIILAFLSFALCGAVVTYIGSAANYKQLYTDQKNTTSTLTAANTGLSRQLSESAEKWKQLEKEYNDKIQTLEGEVDQKEAERRRLERTCSEYEGRVNSWVAVVTSFNSTISNLEQSLKLTQQQLDQTRERSIKDQKELNEITASLYAKITQLQALESDRKRFLEEKKAMEDKLNRIMAVQPPSATAPLVSATLPDVSAATRADSKMEINGLISEISGTLVTLSVGSDDGVAKGTVFHVTRGSEFICNVVITDVDTNKSAGVLELKKNKPRIGDLASTKL